MNLDIAAKYFKLYRDEHNIDDVEHVTDGEVLVWLSNNFNIEKKRPSIDETHANSLRILDEYFKKTPPEEIQALADSIMTSIPREKWGLHRIHCCLNHGCTFGDNDCPVWVGVAKQEHVCEKDNSMDPCFSTPEGRTVFLIEKAWINLDLERINCGYVPIGVVFTLEEAKSISGRGRLFTDKDCWQIPEQGMQEFIYTELKELDNHHNLY